MKDDFLDWVNKKEKLDIFRQIMGETVADFDLIKGKVRYVKKPKWMIEAQKNIIYQYKNEKTR